MTDTAPEGRLRDPLALPDSVRPVFRRAAGLQVLGDLMWPLQALAVAAVIDGWVRGEFAAEAWWIAVFAIAGLVRAGCGAWAGGMLFRVGEAMAAGVRRAVLDHVGRRPGGAVSSAEIGALMAEKIPLIAPYVTRFRLGMMRVRVLPFIYLALAAWVSWAAALVLLVAGPLIPLFMALIGMAAKEASERQMVEIGAMNRILIDRIAALPDARLLGGLERSRAGFAGAAERLRGETMAVLRIAFLSSTVLELFSAIGVAMVAVYVGFSLLGEITFGAWGAPLTLFEGVFLLLLAPEFFQPLRDLAASWHDKAAAEAVAEELRAVAGAEEAAILGQGLRVAPLDGAATVRVRGVRVRNVALPEFEVAPGEGLALVGPSGAGKSTTLEALAGLVPLAEGRIEVAGRELEDASADAWRARLGFVPQHVQFPDLSLRDWLDPEGKGEIEAALGRAHAEGVVAALPEGLETRLGEFGAGVSGGEARRLLLARAFQSGADVILADEPTADLDAETAGLIIEALTGAVAEGRVVIAATHDAALRDALGRVAMLEGAG